MVGRLDGLVKCSGCGDGVLETQPMVLHDTTMHLCFECGPVVQVHVTAPRTLDETATLVDELGWRLLEGQTIVAICDEVNADVVETHAPHLCDARGALRASIDRRGGNDRWQLRPLRRSEIRWTPGSLERDPNTGCKPETAALRNLGARSGSCSLASRAWNGTW
jgi:hypothetical protein